MFVIAEGIATDSVEGAALAAQPAWLEPEWNPVEGKWEL
jgi:hypothetical protein